MGSQGAEPPPQPRILPELHHLVPVDPYPSDVSARYIKECHGVLRVAEAESSGLFQFHRRGTVVMVRRPSFDPEECIALREEAGARAYNLIYTRADRNIFWSLSKDDEKEEHARIKVIEVTRPLDRNRAERVYDLWEMMLKGVRYPEGGPRAGRPDDGETIEFRYSWKGMYGETCSPSRGATKMLADLGDSLILYCKSQNYELEKNLKFVDESCEKLKATLDAKGIP